MIGFIDAYYHDGQADSYQLAYWPMCKPVLEKHFPNEKIKLYRIAEGDRPVNPEECDLWFLSGSAKSCYDTDEWILWLLDFIVKSHQRKSKMVAFCFGHQMVAQALGGKVEKSDKGWGVGIRSIKVEAPQPWIPAEMKSINLLFSHQDQVIRLPDEATLLASSDFCPNEVFTIGQHILSFQGHPEFSIEFAKSRYLARKDQLGTNVFNNAMKSIADCSLDSEQAWNWISQKHSLLY